MTWYFLKGFLLGMSLIMAIGVQNIFIIKTSVQSLRAGLVAALVCILSDILLIAIGVGAAGRLTDLGEPWTSWIHYIAAGFLFAFAAKQLWGLRSHFSPNSPQTVEAGSKVRYKRIIWVALGFSLLNPHAYVDVVLLLGGASIGLQGLDKTGFALGCASSSIVWFFGLAIFAGQFSGLFKKPKAAVALDLFSAGIMALIGSTLIFA